MSSRVLQQERFQPTLAPMAILFSAHDLTKAFGARPLFSGLTFAIESGERIGLIGPNGAGKSTLLRILASEESPDKGTLSLQKGLKVGYLKQTPTFKPGATLLSSVMEGIDPSINSPEDIAYENWEDIALAEECLSKLSLTGPSGYESSTLVDNLSGGWRKRVALARELARKPVLLLLDEPTNHLDIESILWLEEYLKTAPFATLTITHDRAFLQKISNRILELDRRNPGGLLSIRGSYLDYVETKTQLIEGQKQRETVLKNTLRRETEWLRQGAKARTTKQQARIQRAGDLKDEVGELAYRNQSKTSRFEFQGAEKNPKRLMEAKGIGKTYSGRTLFKDFSLVISPGSRIGLLGKNGTGKSTLIRMLLNEEQPDQGVVLRSDFLKVAYFEQNRETLDPELSVLRTLCPSGDQVSYQGRNVHIRSYLDRFLFEPGQMEMAVGKLSGGEQSRLLIARLMLREANLLVLDEPTNDLDLATLNVLEDCLTEFPGAIVLVTHDRYFLDQVANQILAFPLDSGTHSNEIIKFADLAQWEAWRDQLKLEEPSKTASKKNSLNAPKLAATPPKRKLSFNEQRELKQMEGAILQAETEVSQWTAESIKPENQSNSKRLMEISQGLAQAHEKVEKLYQRWTELSSGAEES